MKKITIFTSLIVLLFFILVINSLNIPYEIYAQTEETPTAATAVDTQTIPTQPQNQTQRSQSVTSPRVCVKVGEPTEPMPGVCTQSLDTTSTSAPGGAASCPLAGKRVIGCGSFMSDAKYNRGVCAGPNPVNRGHCGTNYGCYAGSVEATKNSRRAHSIDIDAPAGETVYLPTINGQVLNWDYQIGMSYSVAPGDGGGYGHVFTADSDQGQWIIHLLHTNPEKIPSSNSDRRYKSGDAVTTIAATSYTHLHVNIGLNPTNPNGGPGWMDPESLGMCTD